MGIFGDKIQQKLNSLERAKSTLPLKLSQVGQNYFNNQFQKSQWDGMPWKPRKKETKRSKGKHLLVATGNLKRAVSHAVRSYNWREIIWGIDVPYAKAHNEGTSTAGRGHNTVIPKRRFMGDSMQLRQLFRNKIKQELKRVF